MSGGGLAWVRRVPGLPYFETEGGDPWTPIGQNDAITWPELEGLYRRRDLPAVEAHLASLRASGVTVLRLMLEYCRTEHRYLENPVGRFVPAMVALWDDLFALCERVELRILLTPFDTFFTWRRFAQHPYSAGRGGPCAARTRLLVCPATRDAIKARLRFATERWGGSGALFAWDLWNEMHPAQGADERRCFDRFIDDVSPFLREAEVRLHGRAHPQTVSVFGPELIARPELRGPIFRHPLLDFASTHLYEHGTIDDPDDTVTPAVSTARLTREALAEITDQRPFLDSEHGPIHVFKDKHRTLPEPFDDEYFRHMQWAHLASGGAGGGMRWPNRDPHVLTMGMRAAQRALAAFLPLIDWRRFRRGTVPVTVTPASVSACGCADARQAVVWLVRSDTIGRDRLLRRDVPPVTARIEVPGLSDGRYEVVGWDTRDGRETGRWTAAGGTLVVEVPVVADLALAIRPA